MSNSPIFSTCTADKIREAAATLQAGHLVAFPTETVYGLGADARNPDAVKRIYEVKGRPTDHPLIVHISSINQLEKWAREVPDYAISLARTFWPGPMTLVLKRTEFAEKFVTGGQDTVGLRVPSDPIGLALIQEFEKISGSAIAAPSANRFGQVSPTSAADVQDELSEYLLPSDMVLDGGNSFIGIESTIIDCTLKNPRILRSGFVTRENVVETLGLNLLDPQTSIKQKFSGSFEKHYAPKCIVKLDVEPQPGQGFIAMSEIPTPPGVIRLMTPSNHTEYARGLYSALREADNLSLSELSAIAPSLFGLSVAISDRLRRASMGR